MLVNLGEVEGRKGNGTSPPIPERLPTISPTYFKRTVGELSWAALDFGSQISMPRPKAAAARLGLKFEAVVCRELTRCFPGTFVSAIPISFQEIHRGAHGYSRPSTAIPDGLLLSGDARSLCIIEIKLRHSQDAWAQLNRFYLPLLRKIVGDSLVLRTLEICKYYDPGVQLPNGKELLLKPEEVFNADGKKHSILIWEKL